MNLVKFAKKITQERERKGWSIRELSQKAPCDYMTIKRVEDGDYLPNLKTLILLAKALGKPPAWFLQ